MKVRYSNRGSSEKKVLATSETVVPENICVVRIPEEKGTDNGAVNTFEELIAQSSCIWSKF